MANKITAMLTADEEKKIMIFRGSIVSGFNTVEGKHQSADGDCFLYSYKTN